MRRGCSILQPHKANTVEQRRRTQVWTKSSAEEYYKEILDLVLLCSLSVSLKYTQQSTRIKFYFISFSFPFFCFSFFILTLSRVRHGTRKQKRVATDEAEAQPWDECFRLMYANTFAYFFIHFIFMRVARSLWKSNDKFNRKTFWEHTIFTLFLQNRSGVSRWLVCHLAASSQRSVPLTARLLSLSFTHQLFNSFARRTLAHLSSNARGHVRPPTLASLR